MRHWLMVLLAALCLSPAQAQTRWADEFVHIEEPQTEDVYVAGRDVEVVAALGQDLVAAGQRVSVGGQVGGDLIAAAETLILRGEIADDVRVAGRNITLFGRVGDHLLAAGQRVSVERGAEVGGRAWLAGETVLVAGRIGGEFRAAGREVILSGEIGGDANIIGEAIRIEAGAVVHGDLVWRSETEPEISPEANITGQVIQKPFPEHGFERSEFPGSLLAVLGVVVAGVVTYLLFPRAWVATALAAQASPWKSLGLGLAVLVGTPIVVGLLCATVVGYLLALMLLALYLVTLALGALAGFFSLGDLGLRLIGKQDDASRGLRVLSIIAAIAIIAIVQIIPILGALTGFLVWLIGLGAIQLSLYRAAA